MARNRMISSDFPDNQKLAKVSRDARLTFIEMWVLADDFGVVIGHRVWLNSHCFPYDFIEQSAFDVWIDELIEIGVIAEFEKDGSLYFVIRDWDSHQKVEKPNIKKRLPEAPKNIFDDQSSTSRRQVVDESGTKKKEKKKIKEEEREEERKGGVGENQLEQKYQTQSLAPLATSQVLEEKKVEKGPTPAQVMRQILQEYEHWQSSGELTGSLAVVYQRLTGERGGAPPVVEAQLQKFFSYWTEPTKSGRQQRWETERTFDVFRRMATWFQNADKFQKQEIMKQNNYAATAHLYK